MTLSDTGGASRQQGLVGRLRRARGRAPMADREGWHGVRLGWVRRGGERGLGNALLLDREVALTAMLDLEEGAFALLGRMVTPGWGVAGIEVGWMAAGWLV